MSLDKRQPTAFELESTLKSVSRVLYTVTGKVNHGCFGEAFKCGGQCGILTLDITVKVVVVDCSGVKTDVMRCDDLIDGFDFASDRWEGNPSWHIGPRDQKKPDILSFDPPLDSSSV